MDDSESVQPGQPDEARKTPEKIRRFRPWLFFGVLLGPGVLTVLGILLLPDSALEDLYGFWMIASVPVCLVSGLVCGLHLSRSLKIASPAGAIGAGIGSVILCTVMAGALYAGGCYAGCFVAMG